MLDMVPFSCYHRITTLCGKGVVVMRAKGRKQGRFVALGAIIHGR